MSVGAGVQGVSLFLEIGSLIYDITSFEIQRKRSDRSDRMDSFVPQLVGTYSGMRYGFGIGQASIWQVYGKCLASLGKYF